MTADRTRRMASITMLVWVGGVLLLTGISPMSVPVAAARPPTAHPVDLAAPATPHPNTGYTLTFTEAGLPAGDGWAVNLSGGQMSSSTSTQITFSEPNGTYTYNAVAAYFLYSPNASWGTVVINGANAAVSVTFKANNTIDFVRSGLPAGANWTVNLSGAVNSSITWSLGFSRPNGTYSYSLASVNGLVPTPASGTVTVKGRFVTIPVTFARPTYPVIFTESGLPSGAEWTVYIGGSGPESSSPTIEFLEPNGSYSFTIVSQTADGYAPSPASGTVTVNGVGQNISVWFGAPSVVNFTASGLPTGEGWSVTLNGAIVNSTSRSIGFVETNGTYSYSVVCYGYRTSMASGTVHVSGRNLTISENFTLRPGFYPVNFTETGLSQGSWWYVILGSLRSNSSLATIPFAEPNGSTSYSVDFLRGVRALPHPAMGSVTVNGSNQTIPVTFVTVPATYYTVTALEYGLPSGMSWYVTFNGVNKSSTSTAVTFSVPNGTYSYSFWAGHGYRAYPASGKGTVSGGNASIATGFYLPGGSYSVVFAETGLPSGTNWTVTLGRSSFNTTSSIEFTVTNGTYSYSVGTVSGYNASPASGNVTVNGTDQTVSVTFQNASGLLPLSFRASGLPKSTDWSVTLIADSAGLRIASGAATTLWSNGAAAITFWVSAGEFTYSVAASGYEAPASTVRVAPSATPETVTIGFAPIGPNPQSTKAPSLADLGGTAGIGIGLTLLGASGFVLTVYRSERRRRERARVIGFQLLATEWETDGNGDPVPRSRR
jgi:hypothetical protein